MRYPLDDAHVGRLRPLWNALAWWVLGIIAVRVSDAIYTIEKSARRVTHKPCQTIVELSHRASCLHDRAVRNLRYKLGEKP